jgi:hypothetical protein
MLEYSAYRKGDYYQFLLEFQTNNEKKEAVDQLMKAYISSEIYIVIVVS